MYKVKLSPFEASPRRLLDLVRGHWSIENSSHYVRDVTFGEDRSRLRTGAAPQILAALRNLAITLIHRYGSSQIAATRRHFASHPSKAFAHLLPITQSEVAETFAVSLSSIKRYTQQRREAGHVLPKPITGRPAVKGPALEAGLLEQLRVHPDATREEHCQMWFERTGIKVSTASISRARMALGWTRKKRR